MMTSGRTWIGLAVAALLLVLFGCDRADTETPGDPDTRTGSEWWRFLKENASPKQRVDFTWTMHNAPGPFKDITAAAQYDVINEEECGYAHPMTGTAMRMTTSREVDLSEESTLGYSGTVFLDLLQDGDYYGRGVCRWEFTTLSIVARATGAQGETRFVAFIDRYSLLSGGSVTHYYADRDYPRVATYPDYPSQGQTDLERFRPEVRKHTFSSKFTSKEGRK